MNYFCKFGILRHVPFPFGVVGDGICLVRYFGVRSVVPRSAVGSGTPNEDYGLSRYRRMNVMYLSRVNGLGVVRARPVLAVYERA